MELFDKDGNAVDVSAMAGELGFKTQADIDGAVGSAVERAKRTTAERLKAEIEGQYNEQINSLKGELDAIRNKDDKETEYSKALKLQLEQTQKQVQEMQDLRKSREADCQANIKDVFGG